MSKQTIRGVLPAITISEEAKYALRQGMIEAGFRRGTRVVELIITDAMISDRRPGAASGYTVEVILRKRRTKK